MSLGLSFSTRIHSGVNEALACRRFAANEAAVLAVGRPVACQHQTQTEIELLCGAEGPRLGAASQSDISGESLWSVGRSVGWSEAS